MQTPEPAACPATPTSPPCQWRRRSEAHRGEQCTRAATHLVSWWEAENTDLRRARKRSCPHHVVNWTSYAVRRQRAEHVSIRIYPHPLVSA